MKVYYGLTEEESLKNELTYFKNDKYIGKGVHTSLEYLKKFIKEEKMQNIITHYTIIPLEKFDIINNISNDDKMIIVKTPFTIKIDKVYKL